MAISFLAFVIVFSAVVLVHELGHFVAARKSGVKVYEFSVGFPFSPRLVTLFRHQETDFTLRLLPLGGFVSFSREGDEDAKDLLEVSPIARALILLTGPLFNVVFACLVLVPVFWFGKQLAFLEALSASAQMLWAILSGTAVLILNLLSGHGGMDSLSGPVGIAVMAGRAASEGIFHLFYFTGALSMSLGIMNLLPLPALDGGQLLMLFIETVRKKPLGLKTHQAVNLIGLALFILLSVLVTYRDIVKLVA